MKSELLKMRNQIDRLLLLESEDKPDALKGIVEI